MGLVWIVLALGLGGILKGATGAGAPVVAVPIIALIYDVPTAVTVLMAPNLLSNVWQGWSHRAHLLQPGFVARFAGGGAVGAVLGTWMLASFSSSLLTTLTGIVVWLYIALRLARPGWRLGAAAAGSLALPVGVVAGALQGAAGVSAPVSMGFLNAMRLERAAFVATISVFFMAMTLVQIPALVLAGLMGWERMALSLAAMVPILLCMPLGAWLARRLSAAFFDRVILALLGLIGLRLIADAFI
ncbi:MAG: sulfite exporter TauE/SafE family protein [Pseudomonadota bacterium]